jgi:hypothetical protein
MSWNWRRTNSSPKHGGQRRRLAAGLVRVTKKGRRLNDRERAAVEERLRNDGILPRTNERI